MENKIPEIAFSEGFYIWFDIIEKKEYYASALYLYKTIRKDTDNNSMTIKYNLKNTKIYNNPYDDGTTKHPSSIINPYQEQLGMFLINFLNADFSNSESAYKTFFYAYGFDLLKENSKQYFDTKYDTIKEFLEDWDTYFRKYQKKLITTQHNFKEIVDVIYNLHNNDLMKAGNYKNRFDMLLSIDFNNLSTYQNITNKLNGILYKEKTINDNELKNMGFHKAIDLYNKNNMLYQVYTSDYISGICECVLEQIVNDDKYVIKVCEHCGRYFIPTSRKDEIYCDLPNDDGHSCREKGARQTYKDKIEDDDVLLEYRRSYQKKITAIYRADEDKKETMKRDFEDWKSKARKVIEDYKNKKISFKKAYDWLMKNK